MGMRIPKMVTFHKLDIELSAQPWEVVPLNWSATTFQRLALPRTTRRACPNFCVNGSNFS